jgi:Transposase, Mutator family
MTASHSVGPCAVAVQLLEKHLASASPDLLREMVASLANAMMSAQADQLCGAGYGERSAERVNRRNGYRAREWVVSSGGRDTEPWLKQEGEVVGLVAGERGAGLPRLLRCARQPRGGCHLSYPADPALAQGAGAPQPAHADQLGADESPRDSMARARPCCASLSRRALSRSYSGRSPAH